ncbi:MAG TPA: hypothetical protein VEF06_12940 [Bryobacteraceae bacterium]|nr:hypothetical protein [Bryobacteraceae bacterium]
MSNVFSGNLPLILVSWIVVLAVLMIARQRKHTAGVGLVFAYVLNLWMIHWVASLMYVLPWYNGENPEYTTSGTEQSLYAVAAFAFGSVVLAPFVIDSGILPRSTGQHIPDPRLPRMYLLIGIVFYVLLSTSLGRLPSVTAVISTGQSLAVVGLSLCCMQAWKDGDYNRFFLWLAVSFSLPFFTIITRGFIGYGAVATLSVLIFLSNFSRSRIAVIVIGVFLGYGALSVYVTYMRDRTEIRTSVWGGQSYSNRFSTLGQSASGFEWFDPANIEHLNRIDDRLNQSYLVGAAVAHLDQSQDFARGETLVDAVLALIPRALWPDKPFSAGSGNLVSRYTGIYYNNEVTSVGIGSVMEFYINFGTTGVIIGFLILGVLVTALDVLATERLVNGDLNGFVLYFLPGLSFLQVGGQLVEVTAGAAGAIIVALGTNKYLQKMQAKAAAGGEEGDALAPPVHHGV